MMSRFFTSDQHFGHSNILKYEAEKRVDMHGRPFNTIDQMNDYLVDCWNADVAEVDEVYCLGDFSFKLNTMHEIVPFLNGKKILIVGNHDPFFKRMVTGKVDEAREMALEAGFSEIHMQLALELPGIGLVQLAHFPYEPDDLTVLPDFELRYLEHRPKVGKEKFLLHGHVHSEWRERAYPRKPWMMNVGVDLWGMRPVSEKLVVEFLQYNMEDRDG
jgi:calcineurin-like phosphoesterase family protein